MIQEDPHAVTTELQDEVAAMGLEPKPEAEIDDQSEVCASKRVSWQTVDPQCWIWLYLYL